LKGSTDEDVSREGLGGHGRKGVEPARAALHISRADHPLGVVLTLGGELDLATVPLLQEQLDPAVRGRGAVVVDLSGLRFIDSSGLQMLAQAELKLRASGGQLVLVRGSRAVCRVFELAGLDRHFAWCDSPSATLRTAIDRDIASPQIPKPGADRRTAPELEPELEGLMGL
jgi:anti-sigma B factor antagonist